MYIYIYICVLPPLPEKGLPFLLFFSYPPYTHPEAYFLCCHTCLLEMQKEKLGRWEETRVQSI